MRVILLVPILMTAALRAVAANGAAAPYQPGDDATSVAAQKVALENVKAAGLIARAAMGAGSTSTGGTAAA